MFDEYGFTWDQEFSLADIYDVDRMYRDKGNLFWISEGDAGINGSAALNLFPTLAGKAGESAEVAGRPRMGGCDCSLERLYVHPSFRHQGIATRLIEQCLHEAMTRNRKQMEIWCDARFLGAHKLFAGLGAKVVGQRLSLDPGHSPETGMILSLMRAAPLPRD